MAAKKKNPARQTVQSAGKLLKGRAKQLAEQEAAAMGGKKKDKKK